MITCTSIRATEIEGEWDVTLTHDDGTETESTVTGVDAHEATIAVGNLLIDLNAS
jgi:hypothetical protein